MLIRNTLHSLYDLIKTFAVIFLIAFVVRIFIVQSFRVEGNSMEPNFHHGQFLLVEKLGYRFQNPQRGDVIILQSPDKPNVDFIKRIIGLPGETIEISQGRVKINGEVLREYFLKSGEITEPTGQDAVLIKTLGNNEYFVLGDNRQSSKDSRSIGPITNPAIIGKVFFVIWPPETFGNVARAY